MRPLLPLALLLCSSSAQAQTLASLEGLPRMHGNMEGGRFGLAHTVGDLDCDGLDDLAISSADPPVVWVWSGLADATGPWPGPGFPDVLGTETADLRIVGLDPSFGSALASGDLGGACDSLVIGAPGDRVSDVALRSQRALRGFPELLEWEGAVLAPAVVFFLHCSLDLMEIFE